MLIFQYVCPQTHPNFWNISPDLHQVYNCRCLAALNHLQVRQPSRMHISSQDFGAVTHLCCNSVTKAGSSPLRSCSDNHWRYEHIFRYVSSENLDSKNASVKIQPISAKSGTPFTAAAALEPILIHAKDPLCCSGERQHTLYGTIINSHPI